MKPVTFFVLVNVFYMLFVIYLGITDIENLHDGLSVILFFGEPLTLIFTYMVYINNKTNELASTEE